jgi:hypothetical protein
MGVELVRGGGIQNFSDFLWKNSKLWTAESVLCQQSNFSIIQGKNHQKIATLHHSVDGEALLHNRGFNEG